MQPKQRTDRIVKLGVLAAFSVMLSVLIHFPIIPAVPFLEFDLADIPIQIGGFLYGPFWGLLLAFVVSLLQGVTVSASSGIIGIIMHTIATGAFVVVAGTIYRLHHSFRGAVIALICGALAQILIMIPLNLLLTPSFIASPDFPYDAAQQAVKGLLWPIIAFNTIRTAANAVMTLLLYKSIGKILKKDFIKAQ